jgi:hypothetical protein
MHHAPAPAPPELLLPPQKLSRLLLLLPQPLPQALLLLPLPPLLCVPRLLRARLARPMLPAIRRAAEQANAARGRRDGRADGGRLAGGGRLLLLARRARGRQV